MTLGTRTPQERARGLGRLAERALAAHVPFQVLFELTARCPLDCVHCYLGSVRPSAGELSLAEIRGILRELRDAGALFVTFTGGEVFLRPDVLDVVAEARRLKLAVRLFTSGVLLGRSAAAALARLRPVAVELSVYGPTAAVHDRITRRPGSLRRTLRAAVLLRRAGVPVILKSPALRSTDEAYLGLPELARRAGAGFRLDPSVVTRRDGGVGPTAERVGVPALARLFAAHGGDEAAVRVKAPPPGAALCAVGRRVVRIGPTGLVYPCAVFPEPAGDLRTTPFGTVWRESSLLRRLRALDVDALRGGCAGCARVAYCGRCSALALLEHGDLLGPTREACGRAAAREQAAAQRP